MRRFIPLLLLILSLLTACTPTDNFAAGHPLTKDEMESLSAELFTQGEEPGETSPVYTDREPNTVYWTESGSVYHAYRDCYHLKESKSIKSGTVLTARMAGKERVCTECGNE